MSENDARIVFSSLRHDFTVDDVISHIGSKCGESTKNMLEDDIEQINEVARPKAVVKWCNIDSAGDEEVEVEGVKFTSISVADKLRDKERVFAAFITAGHELESADFGIEAIRDLYVEAILNLAREEVFNSLSSDFGLEGVGMLQPGSLPDWPISNNFAVYDLVGDVEKDTGITLTENGYMRPWGTVSGFLFADSTGYTNCMLCKKFDCVGRKAPFSTKEYERVFKKSWKE